MKLTSLLILIAFFSIITPTPAQINQDSLWGIWSDETESVVTRLEALKAIETNHTNPDTAFYQAQLQFELAKTHGLKKQMAEALTRQGNFYLRKNDRIKANEYYSQSITIAEEIEDQEMIANNSYNMGIGYMKQGDFANGFPLFNRAALLFETLDNKKKQAHALDKIAMLYTQQNELQKSNEYLKRALVLREELLDEDDNASSRMVIAGMKKAIKNQETYLNERNGTPEKSKAPEEFELTENAQSVLAAEKETIILQKEQDTSPESPNQAVNQNNEADQYFGAVGSLATKAQSFFERKDTSKAIPYLEEALTLAQVENELTSLGWIYIALHQSYRATGQYKKSLEMFQLAVEVRDSIMNMENARAVIQQQVKSDYEKQKAIDDLENEKRLAIEKEKKETQQKLSIAIGFGLLLISLLTLIIFNRLKVTQKQKGIIEEQKKKVEDSEKYKEQFLANMSHEIRTPMHAITGMTNILVRKEHLMHQEKFLKAIRQSSRNLLVILNDILDLSKIEAGKIDIQSIPMNLREVVLNVSDLLRVKAEEKGLSLHTSLTDNIPEYIYGDPTRFNQILLNLLGNAIKFTEKGSVSLSVTTAVDKIRFAIQDSGIGIPANQLEQIFKSFEQVNDSTTRKHGGTGLGLTITKQLVTLQNGTIWVESQKNIGSTFFFELPLIPVELHKSLEHQITEDQLKEMAASLSGLSILVVEDDELNAIIAQEDLEYYIDDVTIGYAENGREAVQQFEKGHYDLILMDIQMPELNGYDAAQAIRKIEAANGTTSPIRIIAMTASLLKSEIDLCYAAGMNGYIPKPYKMEELIGGMYQEEK